MDILTKLICVYNNKSESANSNLAKQFLAHLNEIPHISIYELAYICYTSTTAISRFVRRLEYENFHQFKSVLSATLNYYPQYNRKMPLLKTEPQEGIISRYTGLLCNQLQNFSRGIPPEMLDRFVREIARANQLILVSPASFGFDAFQYDLAVHGKCTLFSDNLTDSLEDIRQAGSNSFILFFITAERESRRMETLLHAAKERGAVIGIVSREQFNLPGRYTDLRISYESTGSDMDDRLLTYWMDLLIIRYRQRFIDGLGMLEGESSEQGPE